jgi:hypothetical protein
MTKRVGRELCPCEVAAGNVKHAGLLLFKNANVVVLLNHLRRLADLGPLKRIRDEHVFPEAEIVVIPSGTVRAIRVFEASKE